MALERLYRISCEGRALARRKNVDEREQRRIAGHCAVVVNRTSDTSKDARTTARRLGWTRRTVWFPFAFDPKQGSEQKFDLCPSCTERIPS